MDKEFKLIGDKIIGTALVMKGAIIDSNGYRIEGMEFYKVQRHIPTGKIIIERIGVNARNEFIEEVVLPAMGRNN